MNNLYLQERMVQLKHQEIERELEQAHLLREAGLSRPKWFGRAAKALQSLLVARRERLPIHRSIKQHSY